MRKQKTFSLEEEVLQALDEKVAALGFSVSDYVNTLLSVELLNGRIPSQTMKTTYKEKKTREILNLWRSAKFSPAEIAQAVGISEIIVRRILATSKR